MIDVSDLYAFDLELSFDPQAVQIVDAHPEQEGVQVESGDFLDPGLTLFNTIDPEAGRLRFVMTQLNPSLPKSGSGVLLRVQFRALSNGMSPLTLQEVQMATRDGISILPKLEHGKVVADPPVKILPDAGIPGHKPELHRFYFSLVQAGY